MATKKETKRFLGKEAILAAKDLKTEDVEVPEWGGWVKVGTMTGSQRDLFEKNMFIENEDGSQERNMHNFRATLCCMTIRNEQGKQMFKDKVDIENLGEKSGSALQRVFMVALRLNGMSKQDVDDLTKN